MSRTTISVKRVYDHVSNDDGYRILVDRLWPRGIKKEIAHIDRWIKEVAPSNELRKWFNHDPAKWKEFVRRYREEVTSSAVFDDLLTLIKENRGPVTLLYSAKDEARNQAVALHSYLKGRLE